MVRKTIFIVAILGGLLFAGAQRAVAVRFLRLSQDDNATPSGIVTIFPPAPFTATPSATVTPTPAVSSPSATPGISPEISATPSPTLIATGSAILLTPVPTPAISPIAVENPLVRRINRLPLPEFLKPPAVLLSHAVPQQFYQSSKLPTLFTYLLLGIAAVSVFIGLILIKPENGSVENNQTFT